MSYLYVKWNRSGLQFARLTFASLEHSCVSMATPGTEACDAVGGAFRPERREWPMWPGLNPSAKPDHPGSRHELVAPEITSLPASCHSNSTALSTCLLPR